MNRKSKARRSSSFATVFTLMFCVGLLTSVLLERLPLIIAALYIGMSAITFIAYAIDKSAAQNGQWRTQESTLHIIALIGGWPGALFAQKKLRHKSIKKDFKRVFLATVLLNLVGMFWLHTDKGSTFLNDLITHFY